MPGTTCLARCLVSDAGNTPCEARRHPHPLRFGSGWRVATGTYPVMMTLHPRAQAQVGSGLGLKRPERSCRRWQLEFCSWIYEESYPLGMRRAISLPPSKPVHPRECRYHRLLQYRDAARIHKSARNRGSSCIGFSLFASMLSRCNRHNKPMAAIPRGWPQSPPVPTPLPVLRR